MHEHEGFLDKLVKDHDLTQLLKQATKKHIYVLWHEHCSDGLAARYAAWRHFGDKAEYLPINYNQAIPEMVLTNDTEIYIVDFCISYRDLVALKSKVRCVQIIDHHKEANDTFMTELCLQFCFVFFSYFFKQASTWKDFSFSGTLVEFCVKRSSWLFKKLCRHMGIDVPIFDTTKSGALLAWEYFNPIFSVPDIIRFVSDRDLWQFKYPETKAAIEGLKQSGRMEDFEYWDKLVIDKNALADCIAKGQIIVDYNKTNYQKFVNNQQSFKIIQFDDTIAAVYNTTNNVNELAEEFYLNEHFHIDFTLSYYIRGDGRIKMSFRSRNPGGADVRIVAKKFFGGGHEHSAAAFLSTEQSLEFLKFLQDAEPLPLEL